MRRPHSSRPGARSVSLEWKSDGFRVQGWLLLPKDYDPTKKVSPHRRSPRRPGLGGDCPLGRRRRFQSHGVFGAGLLCPGAQSARQLWAGRGLYPGQSQGLRLWRPARHPGRSRYRAGKIPRRPQPRRNYRLELRRIHDHVRRHPDQPLQGGGRRRRHLQTGRATTARTPSTSG